MPRLRAHQDDRNDNTSQPIGSFKSVRFPGTRIEGPTFVKVGCRRNRLGEPILMPLPNPLLAEFDIHFTMYLDLKVVTAILISTDYSIFWD